MTTRAPSPRPRAGTRCGREPGPHRRGWGSRVKGSKPGRRRGERRAGGGGGVPPAVAGEGEGAEKLRSPRPAPEGSTTPREERLPRQGAGLMRPRCEQHHGWLGAGLAPAPSQAPLQDRGARPGAGSARGGGPSLGAPHHGTDRGGGRGPCHDYATARGLPLPSPVPLTPRNHPYTALHFQGFCRIHLDPQPSTDGAMTRCDRRGDQL